MNYLITYDLKNPGQNYAGLFEAIRSVSGGMCCHPLQSIYLVRSNASAKEICDLLRMKIDRNDYLFVTEIVNNYAGYLSRETWDSIYSFFKDSP